MTLRPPLQGGSLAWVQDGNEGMRVMGHPNDNMAKGEASQKTEMKKTMMNSPSTCLSLASNCSQRGSWVLPMLTTTTKRMGATLH